MEKGHDAHNECDEDSQDQTDDDHLGGAGYKHSVSPIVDLHVVIRVTGPFLGHHFRRSPISVARRVRWVWRHSRHFTHHTLGLADPPRRIASRTLSERDWRQVAS